MKQQYLASTRGRVHLAASVLLATTLGMALGGISYPLVGVLAGIACAVVLVVFGYAVFILEVRTNALTRRGGSPGTGGAGATTVPHVTPATGDPPVVNGGRGAARQLSGPDDERTLWRLSRELPSEVVRVAAIASKELIAQLPVDQTVPLVPGYASEDLETGTYRALVFDRAAFTRGPWAGAESAVGHHLLQQLEATASVARRRRIPVLLVDAPLVPDIGTREVRTLADLILPLPTHEYPPEGAPTSELLATLQRIGWDRLGGTAATRAPRGVTPARTGSGRV